MATADTPSSSATGTALIKSLAACNASARSKTLKSLLSWLQHQHPPPSLSPSDLSKLWKGLFYCVWHSDKAANQSNLINRLSALLISLPHPLSLHYFSHFLLTLRREWPGIDRLRLDKFYLMIRVFLKTLFELMRDNDWGIEFVKEYWGVLEERVFGDDSSVNGVSYHVVSVFCEEIKGFLPLRREVLEVMFGCFVRVLERTQNRVLIAKVKGDVFGSLLGCGKAVLEGKDELVLFGNIAVGMGFSSRFYEVGSGAECVQGNRKVLFGLHEEFSRLEKEFEAAGIDVKRDQVDCDDEVPQLIPIPIEEKKEKKKKKKKDKEGKKEDKEGKKKKKKKSSETEKADMVIEASSEPESPKFSDATLSNLQKQFEVIAAEAGMEQGVSSSLDPLTMNGEVSKKRKRDKKKKKKDGTNDAEDEGNATTVEKSGKKVKFSMKHNLVWNPANPLPPQSVRIPPSVTPRGSALKKGVPAGPVREMFSGGKKGKRKPSPGKKRAAKSKSPAIKRIRKLKSMSA